MPDAIDHHYEIRPAAVEIMSADEVSAITRRYDALINQLEADLEVALDEADEAESRLLAHPAARVVDDDFEAFVLWATESQVVDIRRDEGEDIAPVAAPQAAPRVRPGPLTEPPRTVFEPDAPAAVSIDRPIDQPVDVGARIDPALRSHASEPPTRTATPVVKAEPVSPRSTRLTGRTTVVTRPGPNTATPPPAPAPAATPSEDRSAPASGNEAEAAPPAEKFWDDGRPSRPTRAEREANGRVGKLPATLLMQAGAVIAIVAVLVLKLG